MTEKVRKGMSIYSDNVRLKLRHISDFKIDFDNTYAGYLDN
jgi:hypothetical protein